MLFSKDILRPLTDVELQNLEILYRNNYFITKFHYLTIYNQIKWCKKLKEINDTNNDSEIWSPFRTIFYTHHNGNLAVNGTFVSITKDLKTMISFHTLEPSLQELKECLAKTDRINWMSGPLLTGVLLDYWPFVKEIAASKGGILHKSRDCFWLSIDTTFGSKLNMARIPFGYVMKKLSLENAVQIHEQWPNNKEGSINFVKGLIVLNKCFGIYKQNSNELVAWALQNEYGGIGMLQVMPNERRLGLATVLAIEMTKDICKSEPINVTAFIVKENLISQELFQKIGFRKIVETMWIQYEDINLRKVKL